MTVLVSGATRSIATAPAWVGRFIVPRARNNPLLVRDGRPWAGDNDALAGFDAEAFIRMLEQHQGLPGCLFIAAPDVVKRRADGVIVGNAAATLAKFPRWSTVIRAFGFPVALVLQDGITASMVPWDRVDAVFIGGSDAFKLSKPVAEIVALANALGKHTHMGRVAGPRRYQEAEAMGVQSCDSSGFSRFFDVMCQRRNKWRRQRLLPMSA